MKRITNTHFFLLLKKQINDVSILEKEYDKFAAMLFAESHTTSDITAYHDILVYTRVELSCLTALSEEINSALSEKAIKLIDIQIAWTEKQIISGQSKEHSPLKLKWKGSVVEWVELLYALQSAGCIYHNGKKVSLKQLFSKMGKIFDVKVAEFTTYFMNIKNRADKNRTKFIDLLLTSAQGHPTRFSRSFGQIDS